METRATFHPGPTRWLGVVCVVAATVLAIDLMETWLGFRSATFALNLHLLLMTGAVFVDKLLAPKLASRRFDVSRAEVRLYRRLGVDVFMRVLQRIGWTAALRDPRVFDGTRRTLAAYEQATRHGENAHAWLLVISLGPIAWGMAKGYWDAVLWIGSMSVLFHVYPILLQRTQRARLQALLIRRAKTH